MVLSLNKSNLSPAVDNHLSSSSSVIQQPNLHLLSMSTVVSYGVIVILSIVVFSAFLFVICQLLTQAEAHANVGATTDLYGESLLYSNHSLELFPINDCSVRRS
jgi:hypothetical protein